MVDLVVPVVVPVCCMWHRVRVCTQGKLREPKAQLGDSQYSEHDLPEYMTWYRYGLETKLRESAQEMVALKNRLRGAAKTAS